MEAEAVTLPHPFPKVARVQSARQELEAAQGKSDEERKKVIDHKAFKKLVVDMQVARRSPLSYSPPYTSAPPQTPHYPIMTLQQQQQQYDLSLHPPTPRHHALHYTGPPPRESAEVMLRKLELEEADAKLRASMTQERLQAEIVAKKKAVARALMMEEKGLR
ncbi:hypothetical protein DPSP01_010463 [Paraphaeosphaeria sporulosa]